MAKQGITLMPPPVQGVDEPGVEKLQVELEERAQTEPVEIKNLGLIDAVRAIDPQSGPAYVAAYLLLEIAEGRQGAIHPNDASLLLSSMFSGHGSARGVKIVIEAIRQVESRSASAKVPGMPEGVSGMGNRDEFFR